MNKILIFENTKKGSNDFINCLNSLCKKETIVTSPKEINQDLKNLCPFEFWEKYLNEDRVERIIINSENFKRVEVL